MRIFSGSFMFALAAINANSGPTSQSQARILQRKIRCSGHRIKCSSCWSGIANADRRFLPLNGWWSCCCLDGFSTRGWERGGGGRAEDLFNLQVCRWRRNCNSFEVLLTSCCPCFELVMLQFAQFAYSQTSSMQRRKCQVG